MSEYNPDSYTGEGRMPTLYARAANDAINQWTCWTEAHEVVVEWGQVGGQMQVARFACTPKNEGRSNETTAEVQAVKEAVAKWKKQVKKKYHMSTADASTSLNLKPMLAHEFKKRHAAGKVIFPVDVQPKFDGVRCFTYRKDGALFMQSRGGDPYVVHHLRAALEPLVPQNVVLDGELYVHGEALQNTVSLVKRPQEGSVAIEYRIYDITFIEGDALSWEYRREELLSFFQRAASIADGVFHEKVHYVGHQEAHTYDEVKALHDQFVQDGFEGAIIRQHHGVYRFGYRSHELLKLKEFQDAEFLIIGWTTGKGKFENVPIFKCVTNEGKEFDVSPMGTDAERAKMLANADEHVGQNMTVRFFDWTLDRVPHFPVGVGIREPES